jgi:acetyltransferase-like isoleucine patch superfamily enzyme
MFRKYGLIGIIRLIISWVYTKVFYSSARLIRLPVDIRNRRFIKIGRNFTAGIGCRLEAYPSNARKVLHIGENVQINDHVHITAMNHISIGNDVLIASKVYISDCSHGNYSDEEMTHPDIRPADRKLYYKDVTIEDKVWIGEFVSILPGVTIGRGTIIGTMSVVTKSIPAYCIAAGSPARIIKRFNFATQKWEKEH